MAILKYMLGSLKKRKSYSIVICILVYLAGLILTVTVSTTQNAGNSYESAYNNMEGPHLMYWMEEGSYKPEYKQWFERQSGIQSVKLREQRDINGAFLQHDGKVLRNNIVCRMLVYEPNDNMKLIDGIHLPQERLSSSEIYLPYVYKAANRLSAGDKVEYRFDKQTIQFTVAGFVEDPIYGGELVGGKFLFISDEDMAKLEKLGSDSVSHIIQLRVRFDHYNAPTVYELNKKFANESNLNSYSLFTYGAIKSWHLTLPMISLVVMVAFVLILSIITVTIMRYAILATIEADFTNIGIIKALGFTPFMVQMAITGQYSILALASGILSLISSVFITPVVGDIILNSSGLYYSSRLSAAVGTITILAIVLIISIFSYMTAGRSKKISPVRAISQGIAPIYFSSRLNIRLEKMGFLPFDIRMAVKQILTKSKRYVLLLFISALLSYTLVFLLGLVQMFNSEKAINLLGGEMSDIRVAAETKPALDKLISGIKSKYEVIWATYQRTEQLSVDGVRTIVRIKDNFDATGELTTLRGRHPKHDNEVAVSDLLSKSLKKDMGDNINVKDKNGLEHRFIITGVFQTIDEGGSYVRMLETGMKVLDPGYELNLGYIKLKSHDDLDKTINEMKEKFSGYNDISNERMQTNGKLTTIQSVFSAISALVFILTIVIICFITLLIMKITIYSETRELGIFKALGFSSGRIRLQLALRFVLVTVVGGISGAIVEALCGAQLFALALRNLGISSFRMDFSLINTIIPILMIALLAVLSAYISSGRTKRVSVYSLINE